MKALILNSGLGSRMGSLTKDNHKSMVEISPGLPLIDYQLKTLSNAGIKDFVITTGHMKDKLMAHVNESFRKELNISFVDNPDYMSTNYIYSIYLALNELKEDMFLLHGDLYFDKSILPTMLKTNESCVVVDSTLPLPEKDFKTELKDKRVSKIATYINNKNCLACQPLYKLNMEDWQVWAEAISRFCGEGKTNVYAEEALNAVSHTIELMPLDLKGTLCMEVDTPEDLSVLQSKL